MSIYQDEHGRRLALIMPGPGLIPPPNIVLRTSGAAAPAVVFSYEGAGDVPETWLDGGATRAAPNGSAIDALRPGSPRTL